MPPTPESPDAGAAGARVDPAVGECSVCRHAVTQRSARGSVFWRCQQADHDARLLRYPPLPVSRCPAHERGTPRAK